VSVFNKNNRRFCPTMSYGSSKRSYDQEGCVRGGGVDLRLRRITLSPSQTLRRECSAQRRPSQLYFSHFATGTVYNTVDLYAAIFIQNRVFLPNPPAFDATVRGVPVRISPSLVWHGKTRMPWLPMVKKFRRYRQTHKHRMTA